VSLHVVRTNDNLEFAGNGSSRYVPWRRSANEPVESLADRPADKPLYGGMP